MFEGRKRLSSKYMRKHQYDRAILKRINQSGAYVLAPEGDGSTALAVFPGVMSLALADALNVAVELAELFDNSNQIEFTFQKTDDGGAVLELDTGYRPPPPS
jgi:hypothetical protein